MKWLDITLPVSERYPGWPGEEGFKHTITSTIGVGKQECNNSRVKMGTHFGTHVDAPYHFIPDGKKIHELDLDTLIGNCRVVEVDDSVMLITAKHLEAIVSQGTKRLLIKTRNSKFIHEKEFKKDYTALSVDAVKLLSDRGVKLVGIDYLSIAPFVNGGDVHREFLGANDTIALENVNLNDIEPGEYYLVCLPTKIEGSAGAQARVILGTE